jgi:hypothetical protein
LAIKRIGLLLLVLSGLAILGEGAGNGQTPGVEIGNDKITIAGAEVVTVQSLLPLICDSLVNEPSFCSNDMFDDRFNLRSDVVVQTTGTNVGYSGELGEPAQSGDLHSAWWQWTAPGDGTVTIDTFGSDFDTFLTLAGGGVIHGLSVLGQNDDAPGVLQSQIVYSVTGGSRYQIAVDGFGTAVGEIALNIGFVP